MRPSLTFPRRDPPSRPQVRVFHPVSPGRHLRRRGRRLPAALLPASPRLAALGLAVDGGAVAGQGQGQEEEDEEEEASSASSASGDHGGGGDLSQDGGRH